MQVIRHPGLASDIRGIAMHYAEASEMCPGNASKELFTAKPPSRQVRQGHAGYFVTGPDSCRYLIMFFVFLGALGVLAVQDFSMITGFHVISP